mgnify:FL=1
MKITKAQLKKLIKEQLEESMGDNFGPGLSIDPEIEKIIDPALYRKALKLMAEARESVDYGAKMGGSKGSTTFRELAFLTALKAAARGVESVSDEKGLDTKLASNRGF